MRPSIARLSHMPTGKTYIGWWGDMGGLKQRGIITYTMSPFQQRPMADAFTGYLFNGYRRLVMQVPYFLAPIGTAYFIYTWANKYSTWLESKEGHYATAEAEEH